MTNSIEKTTVGDLVRTCTAPFFTGMVMSRIGFKAADVHRAFSGTVESETVSNLLLSYVRPRNLAHPAWSYLDDAEFELSMVMPIDDLPSISRWPDFVNDASEILGHILHAGPRVQSRMWNSTSSFQEWDQIQSHFELVSEEYLNNMNIETGGDAVANRVFGDFRILYRTNSYSKFNFSLFKPIKIKYSLPLIPMFQYGKISTFTGNTGEYNYGKIYRKIA